MENNKELYSLYQKERKDDRAVPQFDLIKFMEVYKRNVDFYNSYGLDKKVCNTDAIKKPLAQKN